MNKKIAIVVVCLFLGIVLITPSSGAEVYGFPNLSTSSTFTYSLYLDGSCELYTIIRFKNIEHDFSWTPNIEVGIPIVLRSFSEERPNITMVTVGDEIFNYYMKNYNVSEKQSDSSYIHGYSIVISPPDVKPFPKDGIVTVRTKSIINNSATMVMDYYKFSINNFPLPRDIPPFKEVEDFIIKVNLPNDPYYWSEVLHTTPKYEFISSFGRGQSLEWYYDNTANQIDYTLIDYRIHSDQLKEDLDNATRQAKWLGIIAVILGIVAVIIAFLSPFYNIMVTNYLSRKKQSKESKELRKKSRKQK